MSAERDYTINAVKKALDILRTFDEEHTELTLSEISQLTGIGKSSMIRFLYTLHSEEFVSYDEQSKKYSLGVEMYRLGLAKFNSLDLRKISCQHLQKLSTETGMICYLSVREEDRMIMLDQILPPRVPAWIQLVAQAGATNELYSTGNGRLLLSQLSDEEVAAYLDRVELKKFTEATITDKDALMELIRQARRDKFSGNVGENEPHVYSLCAPIYDRQEKIIAACSICGMKDVVLNNYDFYLEKIRAAAQSISHEMGYVENRP